jgi:hypothetical protein
MHRFKSTSLKLSPLSLAIFLSLHATPSFAQSEDEEVASECNLPGQPNPLPQPIVVPPPSPAIAGTRTTLMGYTQYKGDLHSHPRGEGCGGMPSPRLPAAGVFQMAKATGLDFFAITNHDLSASSIGNISVPPWFCYGNEGPIAGMTLYECMKTAALDPVNLITAPFWGWDRDTNEALIAEPLNTDSQFVSLVGYERTAREWNHLNIFDMPEWFWDGANFGDGVITDVMYYLDQRILEGKNPIIQFNHPTPSHWNNFALDSVMASKSYLMEVQPAAASEPYTGTEHFDSFKLALRRGWKLSPVATSDAHSYYSWPNPYPGGVPGDFRGVDRRTGVSLAPGKSLSKANIYDALRNRRTFSSSSPYLSAMYMVNGQPMGSTVSGTGPFEVSLQAIYQLPVGSSAPQKYICNVELWAPNNRQVNGVYGRSLIKTWTPDPQPTFYQATFTLPTYFSNYFFKVNAKHNCADANEAWDSLITAPTWMTASPPQLTLSSGSMVKGATLTSTWTHPIYSSQVTLRRYKWDAVSQTYQSVENSAVPVSNAQQQRSYVWNTGDWAVGTYVVSITDTAYPDVEWFSAPAFVTEPPPPPSPPPPSPPPPCKKPCRVEN